MDFDKLCDLHQFLNYFFHLDNLDHFPFLGDDLLDILDSSHNPLLDDWHLHFPFHFLDNFVDQRDNLLDGLFYFFYPVLVNDPLFDYLDLFDGRHLHAHLHYLFHNFGDFLDLLHGLDDGDDLFHDSFDYLRHLLDMVDYLSRRLVAHCVYKLLYNLFDLDDHWLFDDPLYDFLYNFLNFFDLFLHFLDDNSLLPDDFHFLYFWDSVVDYLFYDDWLIDLNYLLSNHYHFHYLRYFYSLLHNFLDNARHFD